jgi:hypothetical protein
MTDAELSRLYPELASAGRLATALETQLRLLQSGVHVEDPLGSAYAIARLNRRQCQVHVALRDRAFGADFWDRGVKYGDLWAPDLSVVTLAIHTFLGLEACTADLARTVPSFEISAEGRAHEVGELVEFTWGRYLGARPSVWPDDLLHEVLALAAHGRLRRLMPFTSLSRACFSTRTGYPYTQDCPAIEVLRDGGCRVFEPAQMNGGQSVFAGPVAEAVARAEALLPSTVTAARDGTAEDDAA